jgi:hypothetical protein
MESRKREPNKNNNSNKKNDEYNSKIIIIIGRKELIWKYPATKERI